LLIPEVVAKQNNAIPIPDSNNARGPSRLHRCNLGGIFPTPHPAIETGKLYNPLIILVVRENGFVAKSHIYVMGVGSKLSFPTQSDGRWQNIDVR